MKGEGSMESLFDRLAKLERKVAYLEAYTDRLESALSASLPECNGEPGACPHCAAKLELDSFDEDPDVEPVVANQKVQA